MKKTLLFVLVLLGIAQVANGQVVEDWVKLHEPHIYNDMPYRLMKPINYEPNKSYPVIVSLHGGFLLKSRNAQITPAIYSLPRQRKCGIQHTFRTSKILSKICHQLT